MSTDSRFDLAKLDSALAAGPACPESEAFVEMKQLFTQAVANLSHRKAAWLRTQVRTAEDPIDLWLLRGPLLAALREADGDTRILRAAIWKSLDRAFPDAFALPAAPAGMHRFAS